MLANNFKPGQGGKKKVNDNYGQPKWEITPIIDAFNKHTREEFDLWTVFVPDEFFSGVIYAWTRTKKEVGETP